MSGRKLERIGRMATKRKGSYYEMTDFQPVLQVEVDYHEDEIVLTIDLVSLGDRSKSHPKFFIHLEPKHVWRLIKLLAIAHHKLRRSLSPPGLLVKIAHELKHELRGVR